MARDLRFSTPRRAFEAKPLYRGQGNAPNVNAPQTGDGPMERGQGAPLTSGDMTWSVYTVATLPAAGSAGRRAFVSDATATAFASIVAGGGANNVPVYDDGVNWRIG